ncbi:TPA: TraK domain-containing protein [Klebsiella pneumoniae]|uniref:TraK domain-containing protein n=1 Tax=Raoultella ornithinolytica TaxID=54291 RepID=UPI001CCB3C76|nr:type-F conjugative transfer system secretin TraK [Raoultella ornithinolytica]MBZ7757551.1 traK family protein [Raoultella ornithinolytica]
MKRKLIGLLITLNVLAPAVHADEPFNIPASAVNTQAFDEPPDSSEAMNIVTNAVKQVPGTVTSTNAIQPPINTNRPTTTLPAAPGLSPASASSPAVRSMTDTLMNNAPAEGPGQKAVNEAKKRYQPMQNVTVPPGGNIVLPVSLGLQNRIQTTFKNVSVSTTAPPEDTTIYVDGGSVFITTEKDAPVGIMLSEEGVPASTYNLTLIPIDVPGAMIHVQTQLTQNMAIERDRHIAETTNKELLEQAQSGELDEKSIAQDDRKQRIIDILYPVANGEVPTGFALQLDKLSVIPTKERTPCSFNFYAKLGQRLVGARELVDVILVQNNLTYPSVIDDQKCITPGVIATAIFDKAFLQPGEKTELYILRDKLYQERESRVTKRPSLIND